jgi:tetratricopeptide (TPR) repeat protein
MQKTAILGLVLCGLLATSCSVRLYGFHSTFDEGLALFNQGQFEASIPYFKRASEQDPYDAQAYLYLGRAHLSVRQWREAIQPMRCLLRPPVLSEQTGPSNPETRFRR